VGRVAGGGHRRPFRAGLWCLKALVESGDQAPEALKEQAPQWFALISAAKALGCSVFELDEHADRDYWMAAARAHGEFEAWMRARAER
jgi:hypothetical protein